MNPAQNMVSPWLDQRLDSLELSIAQGTMAHRLVQRLHRELQARSLRLRPHAWLSTEWFCPEGVPGIGIPFYLADPALLRLERAMMHEAHGGDAASAMRILRHEAGHAVDFAFRLHRRRDWRETFGAYSQPYPQTYRPRLLTREFVLHLDGWYAQCHPAEDFAETFAVWLDPRSDWRQRYQGWPALRKLEYVDQLMRELAHQPAVVQSRAQPFALSTQRMTLREHYQRKQAFYAHAWPSTYDAELTRLFAPRQLSPRGIKAARWLLPMISDIPNFLARSSGEYHYLVVQVLKDMIGRCKVLDLRVPAGAPQRKLRESVLLALTFNAMRLARRQRMRISI